MIKSKDLFDNRRRFNEMKFLFKFHPFKKEGLCTKLCGLFAAVAVKHPKEGEPLRGIGSSRPTAEKME